MQAVGAGGVGGGGVMAFQFLTDQLMLSQPGGADYAHHITTCPPPPELPTTLICRTGKKIQMQLQNGFGFLL